MVNSRRLQDLLPVVRDRMIHFIAVAELRLSDELGKQVKLIPTSTYRDDEAQDAEYAKGRTAPGPKTTNARAGESWHNFQCAMDVAIQVDGQITWDKELYRKLGAIAPECGLVWGGDWNGDGIEQKNDFDLDHFQYTGGRTLAELQQGQEIA